jgi:cell wall-associated NlpC family hydrolase
MYTTRFLLFSFCVTLGFACSPTPIRQITQLKSSPDKKNTYPAAVVTPFRKKVVDFGKKFVGTSYKYAGQSPKTGFDCSGFTSYVLKESGVVASPASAIQATEGRYVALDRVLPGDLIFFGESKKKISHVALVISRGAEGITCVHSTSSRGVIVENVSQSAYWKPKILFARDLITDN